MGQAGFLEDNVTKPVGALPTDTVATATVTPPPDGAACPTGEAFFSASVTLGIATAAPENPPTCFTLPNVTGMNVADARAAWDATDFTGTFTPANGDLRFGHRRLADGNPDCRPRGLRVG